MYFLCLIVFFRLYLYYYTCHLSFLLVYLYFNGMIALILFFRLLVQSPPRISKQPPTDEQLFQVVQAKINENDKPFLIECEAEGEPAPTYVSVFSKLICYTYREQISLSHISMSLV